MRPALFAACLFATSPLAAQALDLSGSLSLRLSMVDSSDSATAYQGASIAGRFTAASPSGRVRFVYRSRHYLQSKRPDNPVLADTFENRSIFHLAYFEFNDFLGTGSRARLGRIFPTAGAVSAMPVDGAEVRGSFGRFSLFGSGGRVVDPWNGEAGDETQVTAGIAYDSKAFDARVSYLSRTWRDNTLNETGVEAFYSPSDHFWCGLSGAYDLDRSAATHGNLSLSYNRNAWSAGLTYSYYRNLFDQYIGEEQMTQVPSIGQYAVVPPVQYQDVRLRFSGRYRSWRGSVSVGLLVGDRTGEVWRVHLVIPRILGITPVLGGSYIHSEYTEYQEASAGIGRSFGRLHLTLRSSLRLYSYTPSETGFDYGDTYTRLIFDYPLNRHLTAHLSAGAIARDLGDEKTKTIIRARLILRF